MGRELSCGNRRFSKQRTVHVSCAGRHDIRKVEIIRNGAVIHTTRPADWKADISWTDCEPLDGCLMSAPRLDTRFAYYYVRVSFPGNVRAWSSPVRFSLRGS